MCRSPFVLSGGIILKNRGPGHCFELCCQVSVGIVNRTPHLQTSGKGENGHLQVWAWLGGEPLNGAKGAPGCNTEPHTKHGETQQLMSMQLN